MQDLINKKHLFKLSFVYSFLIIILICIPAYFYMQSEIQSYKYNQASQLEQQGLNIQRAIYDFNNSKSDIFYFPKSFSFNAYVYDKNDRIIYSTANKILNGNNTILKKYSLNENRLKAKTLLLIKELNFKKIYLKISLLTISIGIFVFISAYIILKQTITPYKKANSYLDRFFNDAMHEIKTPLGILQLNLELLEEKDKKAKEIKRSLNAVKTLLFTYEDIEYMMKQKRVSYTKEIVDFTIFLKQRVDMFESLAASKKMKLKREIKDNIFLEINRVELQRIIDNTISNAIKYSDESSEVIIRLNSNNEQIIFSVEDFGKGIKDTTKIFNRYHREESIKGGFGIGLNIVKNICEKNNIKIDVKSKLKEGSTFIYLFS
ncbi:sensor histidine kinase [Halarcobacter anaerophilus]|uniref:sensor histidine kinase n=1 Tax=Halarcobacter anaerophilus TaxID=877500 RepID=UPI0005CB79FF|nr:HAMP domain-containing sensor histidine kinase [Halarcobacter anaerophilus]